MDKARPCVKALKQGLSESFTMYFRAHAYHWNVEGSDFSEYHDFFSAIYEDIYGSIDAWAENIRKLGSMAPQSIAEIGMPSRIPDVYVGSDPMEMCAALYEANEVVIKAINEAFDIAEDINEQGIADFLAGRDDMHKKWRWQLNSITGMGKKKEEDYAPVEEEIVPEGVAYKVNGESEEIAPESEYEKPVDQDLIFFGDTTEQQLLNRVERHNRRAPASLQASIETVKAVYRRGAITAGAGAGRNDAGISRVDAFLRLLSSGRPSNPLYTADNDLLPTTHKRSVAKESALVASAVMSELSLPDLSSLEKPEEYVLALAELSGMGYEIEPAIRAAWMRAVNTGENPKDRAMELALKRYESKDADLLPTL
jgi:starvation-inducible DNA-binding protein